MPSSATLQTPSSPQIHNLPLDYFYSATLAPFYSALDSPSRPFSWRVKRCIGVAPIGGSERQVHTAGVLAVDGDHARVVDPPGGSQTCGTRRIQGCERGAFQQVAMLYTARVDVSAYYRARVIDPYGIHEACARDVDVSECSLVPGKSDLSTTCVGAPARGDTRGIDGIKCDACRTGSTCAIRPVGTREDVDTWITAEYQGSECVRTRHRLL